MIIIFSEFVQILERSRVEHFDIGVLFVPVLNDIIHEKVVDLCLGEGEVTAVSYEHMVWLLRLNHAVHHSFQVVHFVLGIVVFVVRLEVDEVIVVLIKI